MSAAQATRQRSAGAMAMAGAALFVVLYFVLMQVIASHAADQPWAIAALLGPAWAVGAVAALKARSGRAFALLAGIAAIVALVVARGGIGDVHRFYLLQHVGVHLALGASFAATLRPGRTPLIQGVATKVHGSLTPDMRVYTRHVTVLWAASFAALACASVLVYFALGWHAWSLFTNLGTPIALLALFVGEPVVRYRLHPEFERVSLMTVVHAYQRTVSGGGGAVDESIGRPSAVTGSDPEEIGMVGGERA